jgi:Uma2 family endonuclease
MAMPNLVERYWTAEDVRALPEDGKRYECVDGVLLVTPSPLYNHNDAIGAVYRLLHDFVVRCRLGRIMFAPADVELGHGTMVQPDLFVAASVTGAPSEGPGDIGQLRLVVEVLSPSTAETDRGLKRRLYQRAGVHEYWIVDLARRRVERWTPTSEGAEVLTSRLVWSPRGTPESIEVNLERFFAKVLRD